MQERIRRRGGPETDKRRTREVEAEEKRRTIEGEEDDKGGEEEDRCISDEGSNETTVRVVRVVGKLGRRDSTTVRWD